MQKITKINGLWYLLKNENRKVFYFFEQILPSFSLLWLIFCPKLNSRFARFSFTKYLPVSRFLLLLPSFYAKIWNLRKMERRERMKFSKVYVMVTLLLFSFVRDLSALSVTVNDVECVYEYVLYEGDTVSGNFVVVDHDIFWSSDHPGIDFIVTLSLSLSLFDLCNCILVCFSRSVCFVPVISWITVKRIFFS